MEPGGEAVAAGCLGLYGGGKDEGAVEVGAGYGLSVEEEGGGLLGGEGDDGIFADLGAFPRGEEAEAVVLALGG